MIITMRQQMIFWGLMLVFMFGLTWLLSDVLLPFVGGFILAYLLDPLVNSFRVHFRLGRIGATICAMSITLFMFVIFFLLFVPILFQQIQLFIEHIPLYINDILILAENIMGKHWVSNLSVNQVKTLSTDVKNNLPEAAKAVVSALQYAGSFSISLLSGGVMILHIISFIIIVPVVSFYLLIDWENIVTRIDNWLPRQHLYTLRRLTRESDEVLALFLRGQFLVCFVQSIYYALTLQFSGLQYGFLIGLLVGILTIVPYVGASLGLAIALLISLKQSGFHWFEPTLILTIFVVGQILEGYVWVPKLVGSSVGLHPLWIMFSLMAFGGLFGFLGILIAVPVMAVLGVVMRFIFAHYLKSKYYLGLSEVSFSEGIHPTPMEGECHTN